MKLYQFLGLVKKKQLTLTISKEKFIALLKTRVGADTASSMDIFSSGKTDYKGAVGQSGFYLRRKRGFFTNSRHHCTVIGTFSEEGGNLIIDLEYKNIPPPVMIFHGLSILFLLFALIRIATGIVSFNLTTLSEGFFNLFAVLVFTGIVSFIIQFYSSKTIEQMNYELENKFHEYTKNKL